MFSKIKSPDGYLSNISRCVKDNGKKTSSMKSHDHHVFLEQLLPLATRGFLPKQVYEPLVELSSFFRNLEHKMELQGECPRNIEKRHKAQFSQWILHRVRKMHENGCVDNDLYNLVCGPSRVVKRYTGYIVNGYRFHTSDRSENRKTQNCGVMVRGDDSSDKEYFGVLSDIFELHYPGGNRVFAFKCRWFDVGSHGRGYKIDDYGFTSVNKTRSLKTDEVYVLESQVEQAFYVQDPRNKDWEFVIKAQPRDFYDMPSDDGDQQALDTNAYQQVEVEAIVEEQSSDPLNINFSLESLATNDFVVEREAKTVELVKKLLEEMTIDDEFINDGDIEEGFTIFSFSLQCILIIGSSLRVQTAKSWVHRLIWLVYLLADWAAYYAIGLVVPIDRLQDQLDTYDIHSFWAPFLLLHIGGPNTIAGFSLEDNELWDRSVLHIVVQAGATVISIYRSLSKRRLLAPTLLVLVAALTRYAGRILALNKGSMEVLRHEKEAKPSVMIVGVEPVELAAHSYDLFRKYKGIFCDLPIKDDREAYKDRRTLFSRKPDQALVEMEMEVSLAYDLFYTKIWTIVENETGKILHIISLVSEVGALVLWALANKQGYHRVDIKLTNALLVGGLFLDVVSLLKLVFSDLAICHLIKWDSGLVTCAMNQVLWVRNRAARWVLFRRWSGSIKQFDLMRYKGDDCCGLRGLGKWMAKTFGIEWGVSDVKLSDDLKNHIFMNIRIRGLYSGSKNKNVGMKTSIELGEYVLDMWDPNEPIANAIQHICRRLGVVHTLIVWHTATYWFCANKQSNELSQCKLLSKYMMYLLFYRPKMILEGAQLDESIEDTILRLEELKKDFGSKEQLNSSSPSTNYGDLSNLFKKMTPYVCSN
ncbi:hypothetical protein V2J09_001717 [Rumex salicifolius]